MIPFEPVHSLIRVHSILCELCSAHMHCAFFRVIETTQLQCAHDLNLQLLSRESNTKHLSYHIISNSRGFNHLAAGFFTCWNELTVGSETSLRRDDGKILSRIAKSTHVMLACHWYTVYQWLTVCMFQVLYMYIGH